MKRTDAQQKNTESPFPLIGSLAGMALIVIGLSQGSELLPSLGTWLIFAMVMICFLVILFRRSFVQNERLFILFITSLLSLLFSFAISYQYFVNLFCFWELPILLSYYKHCNKKNIAKGIFLLFFGLSVYYLCLYTSEISYAYWEEGKLLESDVLMLGFSNPNQTGIYLFSCMLILSAGWLRLNSKILKSFLGIDILAMICLIIRTESRTCILLTAIFLVVVSLRWILIKQLNRIRQIACVFPILFVFFLLFFDNLYEGLELMGEAFDTGRHIMFRDVLMSMDGSEFVLGDYATYHFQNLHNAYISIFATTGILGACAFYFFLYRKIQQMQRTVSKTTYIPFVGFLMLLIHSSVEAAFFTAGSAYAVSVVAIYYLVVQDSKE